jgi:hypothetical protein
MHSRFPSPLAPTLLPLLVMGLLGCSDSTMNPGAVDPDFELVNPFERTSVFNSHVYGSFAVSAGGVIRTGPANFPGRPNSGPGTCFDGLWYNAQGKATSGSLTKPHPHCFSASATIEVVLEPITSCYTGAQEAELPLPEGEKELVETKPGVCPIPVPPKFGARTVLTLSALIIKGVPQLVDAVDFDTRSLESDRTEGQGIVTAYAIDASTLGTTNKRVGTLRFDLSQYSSTTTSYLHLLKQPGCDIDELIESPCLDKVITAVYNPLPADLGGIGPLDTAVEGFLWVTPASSPYNYTDK